MSRLLGVKAVVTGAGGMMGGAIATRFVEEGADVLINDRLADRLDARLEALQESGRDVFAVPGNVTKAPDAKAVVEAAVDRWGHVDVLVNVVGGIRGPMNNPIWEISEEDWEFALGINLRGTFHCTQAVLPSMMERRHGKIVNIASVAWAGEAMHAHYSVAKAGVVAFTRSVASQLGPFNINVNAIAPGDTERSTDLGVDETIEGAVPMSISGTGPLGRPNRARDIADAALFLASEESRNISGQLITVAGGNNPSL